MAQTRKRLDPATRRRQIAEAAARVFAEHDPAEVNFELVADEAGVSRSLVYSYFGDRGSLFAAAYVAELARLDAEIGDALDAIGSNRERLRRAVRAYLHFASSHRAGWQLIASASASRHPAVKAAVQDRIDRIAVTVADTEETRMLIRAVIGMLEAAAIHTLDFGSREEPIEMVETLTTVLWSGLTGLDSLATAS